VTTEWSGTAQGQPYFSTHHFAGTASTVATSAVAAVADFWSAIDNFQHTSVTWTVLGDVEVVDEATGALTNLYSVAPITNTGVGASAPLPWATQGLIRWRTGAFIDGRELRGRTYVPGLTTGALSNGSMVAATISGLDSAAEALIANASTNLVVWQRPRKARVEPPLPARAGSLADVVSASVWSEFATLRSRRD
jgi:hypothetical protein